MNPKNHIILFYISFIYYLFLKHIPDQQCSTPDRKVGTCISILECPPLLEVLKNTQRTAQQTQFLQQSQCDQVGNFPYVRVCIVPNDTN